MANLAAGLEDGPVKDALNAIVAPLQGLSGSLSLGRRRVARRDVDSGNFLILLILSIRRLFVECSEIASYIDTADDTEKRIDIVIVKISTAKDAIGGDDAYAAVTDFLDDLLDILNRIKSDIIAKKASYQSSYEDKNCSSSTSTALTSDISVTSSTTSLPMSTIREETSRSATVKLQSTTSEEKSTTPYTLTTTPARTVVTARAKYAIK